MVTPIVMPLQAKAPYPQTLKPLFGAGGSWDTKISQNQLASRLIVEVLGIDPWTIGLARNRYERVEKVWGTFTWLAFGIGLPLAVSLGIRKHYATWFTRSLGLKNLVSPLNISFKTVENASFKPEKLLEALKEAGHGKISFVSFTPQERKTILDKADLLRKQIIHGKLAVMLTDLLGMAVNGLARHWGKNWITERLSGEKGFSGEFDYTSKTYRQKKSEKYEANKDKNALYSVFLGLGESIAFPLMLFGVLQSQKKNGLVGNLKKLLPAFDYHKGIFMSRWLIFWHGIFGWYLPGLLASRDSHETRELTAQYLALDFFFFVGDHLFETATAMLRQRQHQQKFKAAGVNLVQPFKIGRFSIPMAVPFHHWDDIFAKKKVPDEVKKLVLSSARWNFWTGLIGTSLSLGVTLTLLNNWYTKQKALKEQAALKPSPKQKPSIPPPLHRSSPPIQQALWPTNTYAPTWVANPATMAQRAW